MIARTQRPLDGATAGGDAQALMALRSGVAAERPELALVDPATENYHILQLTFHILAM